MPMSPEVEATYRKIVNRSIAQNLDDNDMTEQSPAYKAAITREVRLALTAADLRKRLVAAEHVAALAADHERNCPDDALHEAVVEWWGAVGYVPPAAADEVGEASWEAQSGR